MEFIFNSISYWFSGGGGDYCVLLFGPFSSWQSNAHLQRSHMEQQDSAMLLLPRFLPGGGDARHGVFCVLLYEYAFRHVYVYVLLCVFFYELPLYNRLRKFM